MGTLVIEPIPCLEGQLRLPGARLGGARRLPGRSRRRRGRRRRRWRRGSWCCGGSWPPTTTPITWAASPSWPNAGARTCASWPAYAGDRGRIPGQTVFVEAPGGPVRRHRSEGRRAHPGGAAHPRPHPGGHGHRPVRRGRDVPPTCSPATPCSPPAAAACSRARRPRCYRSLTALTALPGPTRLWFGHEYTAGNLRFAATVEPDNAAITARRANLPACTTPTTVALERATNPFVRAGSVEEMAARRAAKDKF